MKPPMNVDPVATYLTGTISVYIPIPEFTLPLGEVAAEESSEPAFERPRW